MKNFRTVNKDITILFFPIESKHDWIRTFVIQKRDKPSAVLDKGIQMPLY